MNRTRVRILCGMAGAVLCLAPPAVRATGDKPAPSPSLPGATNLAPTSVSPVEKFRKILAMTPAERDKFLTIYPPETRDRILEKVQQYQLLPPDFRELRLRVTELRWYLLPLLKTPATNRAERLSRIPEPYRKMVAARLQEWDIWPPTLKEEVLKYEGPFHYFVSQGVVKNKIEAEDLPRGERPEMQQKLAQFLALPAGQRQQLYASFQHYFDLSEEEKQDLLDTLSLQERQETKKALGPIEKWSKTQQDKYFAALRQFGNMSKEERERFMIDAAKWQKMSPEERQACRDVVKQMADSPPLPMGVSLQTAPAPEVSGATPVGLTNLIDPKQ